MPRRCKQQRPVKRPHWIVFVIAILGIMHIIYG